jgi:hypothetical protein
MSRSRIASGTAAALVGTVVLTAALLAPPAAAAARPVLETHESLRQTLAFRASGSAAGVTIRERRRMRASVVVPLPGLDPAAVTTNTYVGLRIGDFVFQRPVSFDPAWKTGRTRATFRVASTDANHPGVTTVRARWGGGVLGISVVSTSEAPLAAANDSEPAGAVSAAIDGAARLGSFHVHLGGTASGTMTRTVVPVLDGTADLARLSLAGHADVADDSTDTKPPLVTFTQPAALAIVAPGTLDVAGTVRDDRSVAALTWSIDDGAPADATFDADPSTGFLDDLRGTFAFSVSATAGKHTLRVAARDAAGNTGTATVVYNVAVSGAVVLRTPKWAATCVDAQGRVQQWGYGTFSPAVVPGLADARVAEGNLALLADGTLSTLQGNPYGSSSSNAPFAITGVDSVADIAHSSTTTASYALKSDGTVWAWGDNSRGQLGDGTTTARYPPIQVQGLPAIQAISAGAYHALALDVNGEVWTWGSYVAQDDASLRSPRKVAGVANATSISASQFDRNPTGAAILADGTLWMWGDETSGQLGSSTTERDVAAFQVPDVSGVKSIALGYSHALLLLNDGTVLARGGPTPQVTGYWGELGDGTLTPHLEFQPVSGLSGVAQVAAGAHTSAAVLADGTIRAWGQNTYGSLGDGTTSDALAPALVLLQP